MFYLYWILMMISILSSFAYMSNAYRTRRYGLFISSMVQCGCTLLLVMIDLISSLHISTLSFGYLWNRINAGQVGASFLIFLYLLTFSLVILNGKMIISDKKDHSIIVE